MPCFSFSVSVIQHFFRQRLCTPLDAHGTNASPGELCARTRTNVTFSCWCGCVRRLELVELGAATCVLRGIWLGLGLKKKQNRKNIMTILCFFLFYQTKSKSTSTLAGKKCLSTTTFGPCPQNMLQVILSGSPSY